MASVTSFDPVASYYDFLARMIFGKAILKSQMDYLEEIPGSSDILIFGGGTGKILTQVLNKRPKQITYLEASPEMLKLAREKVIDQTECKIHFISGTEHDLPMRKEFDVIITPFVLDVFQPGGLHYCMNRLVQCLKDDGTWLFSDFRVTNHPINKWWQRFMIKIMYRFFRTTCKIEANRLLDFGSYFKGIGLKESWSKLYFSGFIQAKAFRFQA